MAQQVVAANLSLESTGDVEEFAEKLLSAEVAAGILKYALQHTPIEIPGAIAAAYFVWEQLAIDNKWPIVTLNNVFNRSGKLPIDLRPSQVFSTLKDMVTGGRLGFVFVTEGSDG